MSFGNSADRRVAEFEFMRHNGTVDEEDTPVTFPPDAAPTPQWHSAPGQAQPGTIVAERYELTERIGDGGHGSVWRARDQLLQRDVAVKEVVLPPELPPDERQQVCDRTLREAQAAAKLSHASVVRVFDVITEDGRPWIVMELLQARSLANIISTDGPLPPRVVAKIGAALAGALEAAHESGILHRDVKPGNVMLSGDGRCVLSDFGAAAAGSSGTGHTAPGMVLGSAHYIAPERAIGGNAEPASDLFSLGVTMYTALEGRPPFDRNDTTATMNAVVHDPPEAPLRSGPLTPLLGGLLEKDPARRTDVRTAQDTLNVLLQGPLASDGSTGMMPTSGMPVSPSPASGPPTGYPAPPNSVPPATSPTPVPPGPQQPSHQPPQYPPPPAEGGYGGYQPPPEPAPAKPKRSRTGPLLGVGIGVLVLALFITVGVMMFGGSGESAPPNNAADESESKEDSTEYETYEDDDGKFSVEIPKGWKVEPGGETYVNAFDPESRDRWLRLNVPAAEGDPKTVLQGAFDGAMGGQFDADSLNQISLEPATLDDAQGHELEYTGARSEDGQDRHAIWTIANSGPSDYHVYLSVPESEYEDSLPIYEHAIETYQITG